MTEDRPNRADLLSVARQHLLDRVLPRVPEADRLDVLMVANAMAIAARESGALPANDRAALADLLSPGTGDGERAAPAGDRLDRELVRQIRAGAFDAPGEKRSALLSYLERDVTDRLSLANPKYLARRTGT